jgi:hypothetical protein
MADDLTPTDYAFLILLMIEGRQISNKEMKERHGVTLISPTYQRLNGAGLVDSKTARRPYLHELTKQGRKALGVPLEVGEDKKKRSNPEADKLWAALSALHKYHLGGKDQPQAPQPVHDGLGDRIRTAYADLAAEPGAWVSLTRLRPLFSDVSKADLDKALELLLDAPDVDLEPEPNQKTLRVADRKAAVNIGGEDRHLLAIGMR